MQGLHAEFPVAALGRVWTLRLDFNALAAFEEAAGQEALASLETLLQGGLSVRVLRQLVWAMLLRNHPDATLTDAGDLMSVAMADIMAGIGRALPQEPAQPGNPDSRASGAASG